MIFWSEQITQELPLLLSNNNENESCQNTFDILVEIWTLDRSELLWGPWHHGADLINAL